MNELEPYSIEYWIEYKSRLEAFKMTILETPSNDLEKHNLQYDYKITSLDYNFARLCSEINRCQTIISILGYKYETRQITYSHDTDT